MPLYPSFIYSTKANQLSGTVVEPANTLLQIDAAVRDAFVAAGQGAAIDIVPNADLSKAGFTNSAAVVLTFTGTTAITLDLTALVNATGVVVSGAGTFAGSFATWSHIFLQNIGASAKSVALAPGGSNPLRTQLSGTTPVHTILGGDFVHWNASVGLVVDSTHKTITLTPVSGGSALLSIQGT